MAPMSRGDDDKAGLVSRMNLKTGRRKKTMSSNKHRFESFSERISKLKIQPVRRNRQHAHHPEDGQSLFRTALDEWRDQNMSENFTAFAQQASPLCESLVQVLHYDAKLVTLVLKFVEKGDVYSSEPLLTLLTQLAYDLGPRFEPFFQQAVQVVSTLASAHEDVEIIEWTFNCLAALFKFFEPLLVQDLRPLYDLMAPLLGKIRQKAFVTRFAAEALSYLVRKASTASVSERGDPLDLIVRHSMSDLVTVSGLQRLQYQQGVMAMFATATKGAQRGVRIGGPKIIQGLLRFILDNSVESEDASAVYQSCFDGIITYIIHQTDAEGFSPILRVVLETIDQEAVTNNKTKISVAANVLFTISGVRKGSRIPDCGSSITDPGWSSVLRRLEELIELEKNATSSLGPDSMGHILRLLANVVQYCPLPLLKPRITSLLDSISGDSWKGQYLRFCSLVATAGKERFDSLVLSHFQRFITDNWATHRDDICAAVPVFDTLDAAQSSSFLGQTQLLDFVSLVESLRLNLDAETAADLSALYAANTQLDILRALAAPSDFRYTVVPSLRALLLSGLASRNKEICRPIVDFALGKASHTLFCLSGDLPVEQDQWIDMLTASDTHACSVLYLRAVLEGLSKSDPGLLDKNHVVALVNNVLENLAASSHDLRLVTLELFAALGQTQDHAQSEAINTALTIERMPASVENARELSLQVRKLGLQGAATEKQNLLPITRIITAYCFGLLHFRLATIWDPACDTISVLCGSAELETEVIDRCLHWLRAVGSSANVKPPVSAITTGATGPLTEFQCSNVLQLRRLDSESRLPFEHGEQRSMEKFSKDNERCERTSSRHREQALRLMKKLANIVEKRSRIIIPIFFEWFDAQSVSEGNEIELGSEDDTLAETVTPPGNMPTKASREDKKILLQVFSLFVNPGVLYRASEVHSRLLEILCTGDVDIQRWALKALFAWQTPFMKPYQENLLNLLDDVRFREELTVFLNVEEDSRTIQDGHKAGLMPVLLRLLYGRVVAKSGAKSKSIQHAKRKAVLLSLSRFGERDLGAFLDIAIEPLDKLHLMLLSEPPKIDEDQLCAFQIPLRKQLGTLRMLFDVLTCLSNMISPFSSKILEAISWCLIKASRPLDRQQNTQGSEGTPLPDVSLHKAVRHEALRCLNQLFICDSTVDMDRYASVLVEEIIRPRSSNLPIETAQGISISLQLFSTWSLSYKSTPLLLSDGAQPLIQIAACLVVPSAKDEVKRFVLEQIIKNVLVHAQSKVLTDEVDIAAGNLLQAQLNDGKALVIFEYVTVLLNQDITRECLHSAIDALINLAPFLKGSTQIERSLQTSLSLLKSEDKRMTPHVKGKLLHLLERYWNLYQSPGRIHLALEAEVVLSRLFSYFLDSPNRVMLTELFLKVTQDQEDMAETAKICSDLNAFASSKLDEPDFDRRLAALHRVHEGEVHTFSARQWRPLIHNMLYLLRDQNDLSAVRTSCSLGLRKFVQIAANSDDVVIDGQSVPNDNKALFEQEVLQVIFRGMREESELIRLEYILILSEIVKTDLPTTRDLQPLLGSDDDDSFFENVLHIQQPRRLTALRKLAEESHNISSDNISRIFMGMLETVLKTSDERSQNLADEAIKTMDALAESLKWDKFKFLLSRMINERTRFDSKQSIRTLAAVVNALSRAHKTRDTTGIVSNLSKSLPSPEVLSSALSLKLLPKLLEYIHFRDESTVDLRIAVATIAVKVILVLPDSDIAMMIPPVLIDVCNILKSKAQEARDAARKTLADITALIGPQYFGFIIKQLRSSLPRGAQLHVLSYTIHSLLVSVSSHFMPGELDYCLFDLSAIIADDVFGVVGQEKENRDYISKMKEVKKKTLGYDSLELLASITSPSRVGALLKPIQEQIEKPRPKFDKVDEMLRRVREGLRRNERFNDQQALILCYELLQEGLSNSANHRAHAKELTGFKMVTFALDLLRRLLDKHESLKSPESLQGFMPLIGNVIQTNVDEECKAAAMRLITAIIKVPLPELDSRAPEYIKLCRTLIEAEPDTNTTIAQTSLRLMSAVLRERPYAVIKKSHFENHVAYILTRVRPDMHEPAHSHERGRQVGAFNFLKAVLGRGVLITEVYDIMDTVREILVTSPEQEIRSSARAVYSRFVLDYYPEAGKGFAKQLDFLRQNLQYEMPRGRQSVMEVVDFILAREKEEGVQQITAKFFEPLLDTLVTDADADCHDIARLLLGKLFAQADSVHAKQMMQQLHKLIDPGMPLLLQRAGYQGWDTLLDAREVVNMTNDVQKLAEHAREVVESCKGTVLKKQRAALLEDVQKLYVRLCQKVPNVAFAKQSAETWLAIAWLAAQEDHFQVRKLSMQLTGLFLADFARSSAKSNSKPFKALAGSDGLRFTKEDALRVIDSSASFYRVQQGFDQELAGYAGQNLRLVGRLPLDAEDQQAVIVKVLGSLCTVIRLEGPHALCKLAATTLLGQLCKDTPAETLQLASKTLILTLSNLIDAANAPAFGDEATHEQTVDAARELLSSLRSRLGSNTFVTDMQAVQSEVKERREQRRAKRSIQAVTAPEKHGREKARKQLAKRAKRKERNELHAGRRRGY